VTPGDRPEGHQVELLISQHRWLAGRKPEEVVADRGYSHTRVYDFLWRQRILPTIGPSPFLGSSGSSASSPGTPATERGTTFSRSPRVSTRSPS